ncbi:hypothetical protein [Anaerocolumna jejuensis]|uniref:hypothetical protein n=1 Tax=Anaerocolumna jejuensis TaxID=259063 RepID=UPI003F7BFB89
MAKEKPMVDDAVSIATFTKQQLVSSKKYAEKKDLLNALLVDDRSYSMAEVEEILDGFLKGKVI